MLRSREMKELPRDEEAEVEADVEAFIGIGYHWGFQGWESGKGEEGEPLTPPPHLIHWDTKGKAVGVVEERVKGALLLLLLPPPLLPLLLLLPGAREEKWGVME